MDIKHLLNPSPRSNSNPEVQTQKSVNQTKRLNTSEPNTPELEKDIRSNVEESSYPNSYRQVQYNDILHNHAIQQQHGQVDYNPFQESRNQAFLNVRRATTNPTFIPDEHNVDSPRIETQHRQSVPFETIKTSAPYSRHQLKQKATPAQIKSLEEKFEVNRFPTLEEISAIAEEVKMKDYSVKFWYLSSSYH